MFPMRTCDLTCRLVDLGRVIDLINQDRSFFTLTLGLLVSNFERIGFLGLGPLPMLFLILDCFTDSSLSTLEKVNLLVVDDQSVKEFQEAQHRCSPSTQSEKPATSISHTQCSPSLKLDAHR